MSAAASVELDLHPAVARNLLDLVSVGMILLIHRNTIVWTNTRAAALLASGQQIRVEAGKLCGADWSRDRRLREGIDAVYRAFDDGPRARLLRLEDQPNARGAQLVIASLSANTVPLSLPCPALLVMCWDDEETPSPSPVLVERLYQLTPAEARVATLIAGGRSVAAIAAELRVRANTVRAHLKAIYIKTGAIGQADLVRRLLCGPAGIGCFAR